MNIIIESYRVSWFSIFFWAASWTSSWRLIHFPSVFHPSWRTFKIAVHSRPLIRPKSFSSFLLAATPCEICQFCQISWVSRLSFTLICSFWLDWSFHQTFRWICLKLVLRRLERCAPWWFSVEIRLSRPLVFQQSMHFSTSLIFPWWGNCKHEIYQLI